MAIRKVLRMGHPTLRQKARELNPTEIGTPWFKALLDDMVETMHAERGVGLAAPQIGESVRVAVIEFSQAENDRYENIGTQSLSVFINPTVEVLDPTAHGFWEGCLSVPGLRGYVERPSRIRIRYLDEHAQAQEREVDGFLAVVFQHEFDHLDGVLYVDRVQDKTKLMYIEEYQEFVVPHGPAELGD